MGGIGKFAHRVVGLGAVIALTLVLLFTSRFWVWTAPWGGDGLFGLKLVPPFGNTVQFWLRGTIFSDFSVIIWGCGAIVVLSILHWLASRLIR